MFRHIHQRDWVKNCDTTIQMISRWVEYLVVVPICMNDGVHFTSILRDMIRVISISHYERITCKTSQNVNHRQLLKLAMTVLLQENRWLSVVLSLSKDRHLNPSGSFALLRTEAQDKLHEGFESLVLSRRQRRRIEVKPGFLRVIHLCGPIHLLICAKP